MRELASRIGCPVLVAHGSDDAIRSHSAGAALAKLTGGTLVTSEGSGHALHTRMYASSRLARRGDSSCSSSPFL